MTTPATSGIGSDIDVLHDCQILLGLPVSGLSLQNLVGDADIIMRRLAYNTRAVQAIGWYCFNRRDRVALTYDEAQQRFPVQFVHWVKTTNKLPQDNPNWPDTYAVPNSSNNTFVMRRDTNAAVFEPHERDILFDVCQSVSLGATPEAFKRYIAAMTARQLAKSFAAEVDPTNEPLAWEALLRLEASMTPKANVMTDSVDTLLTWSR